MKFIIACTAALLWTMISVWLSAPWMDDLGRATHPLFALFAITFIAYVPGFMNAFLVTSLLLDRRPRRSAPAVYPGVTILIAAYNEQKAIADTICTVAGEDYLGPIEVIVLSEGSSDRTVELAEAAASSRQPRHQDHGLRGQPREGLRAQRWAAGGQPRSDRHPRRDIADVEIAFGLEGLPCFADQIEVDGRAAASHDSVELGGEDGMLQPPRVDRVGRNTDRVGGTADAGCRSQLLEEDLLASRPTTAPAQPAAPCRPRPESPRLQSQGTEEPS